MPKFNFARIKQVLTDVGNDFFEDEVTTRSAALAFYTALALAPLVILLIVVLGALGFDMQKQFIAEAGKTVGDESAKLLSTIISGANERPDLKSISGIFAGLGLLISASAIFVQLQDTLNIIFDVEKKDESHLTKWQKVKNFFTGRLFSVGMLLSFIFILIVSLAVSAAIDAVSTGGETVIWEIIHQLGSFAVFTLLFGLIFKWMPDKPIDYKSAFYGGALTALLFMLGKVLISLYLANSATGSAYGAAGSLLVTLVWVYYSGLVVFVGAELSYSAVVEKSPQQESSKSKVVGGQSHRPARTHEISYT